MFSFMRRRKSRAEARDRRYHEALQRFFDECPKSSSDIEIVGTPKIFLEISPAHQTKNSKAKADESAVEKEATAHAD